MKSWRGARGWGWGAAAEPGHEPWGLREVEGGEETQHAEPDEGAASRTEVKTVPRNDPSLIKKREERKKRL